MGFWSLITDWFKASPEPAQRHLDSDADSAVAVLEGPEEDTIEPPISDVVDEVEDDEVEVPPAPWWQPGESPVIAEPRLMRPHLSEKEDQGEAVLLKSLESALSDTEIALPHLPQIPQQILLLTRDPRSSMPDIARLVSQDQVLSADLLRRANSAAYGGSSKVTALNAALARLGMRGIRSFMIGQSVKQITLSIGGGKASARGESLWKQSLASAYTMAGLAGYFKVNNEDAFLVGLLHDIGKVVVLRCCHDAEMAVGRPVSDRLFAYICQEYHELMGEMIAERWQLPPEVGQVIARHHGPLDSDDPQAKVKGMVQMTDAILCLLGYAPAVNYDLLQLPAARFLHVEDRDDFLDTLVLLPEMVELGVREMQSA